MARLAEYLPYVEIVLSVLLIAVVLLQRSDTEGAGGSFGGNDNFAKGYHTRRGLEKVLFNSTVVLGILFAVAAFLNLIYR